ncbi:MAG: hypothetical protein AAGF12_03820 [Myxococcota bacterium]
MNSIVSTNRVAGNDIVVSRLARVEDLRQSEIFNPARLQPLIRNPIKKAAAASAATALWRWPLIEWPYAPEVGALGRSYLE